MTENSLPHTDQTGGGGLIPRTMQRYGMRGIPTRIVVDRDGLICRLAFGQVDDPALDALLDSLAAARRALSPVTNETSVEYSDTGCLLPMDVVR